MPSGEHEAPVELARADPEFVGSLLSDVLEKVPDYDHARPHAADVRVMVPRTYHADSMTLFCDAADRPLFAAVLEVQRGWDITKRRTWKLYVAQLETEMDVDAALLVYCPDPAIAHRYRALLGDDGWCLSLRPLFITPDGMPLVVDLDVARASPSVAVFAALCHGDSAEVDAAFPALVAALHAIGPGRESLYYDIVLAGLPLASRTRWEAFMTTAANYQYRSQLMREMRARALAEAILVALDDRGVAVSDDVRDRILECTDTDQLGTWLHRAFTATTVDDVIGG